MNATVKTFGTNTVLNKALSILGGSLIIFSELSNEQEAFMVVAPDGPYDKRIVIEALTGFGDFRYVSHPYYNFTRRDEDLEKTVWVFLRLPPIICPVLTREEESLAACTYLSDVHLKSLKDEMEYRAGCHMFFLCFIGMLTELEFPFTEEAINKAAIRQAGKPIEKSSLTKSHGTIINSSLD